MRRGQTKLFGLNGLLILLIFIAAIATFAIRDLRFSNPLAAHDAGLRNSLSFFRQESIFFRIEPDHSSSAKAALFYGQHPSLDSLTQEAPANQEFLVASVSLFSVLIGFAVNLLVVTTVVDPGDPPTGKGWISKRFGSLRNFFSTPVFTFPFSGFSL